MNFSSARARSQQWDDLYRMPKDARAEAVRTEIEKAFPVSPRPRKDEIIDPTFRDMDDYGHYVRILANRNWTELTHQQVFATGSGLYYLTDKAFLYYFPAFVVWSLDYIHSAVAETLLWNLCVDCQLRDSRENVEKRLRLLTEPQFRALRGFLLYIRDTYQEDFESLSETEAFIRYWSLEE